MKDYEPQKAAKCLQCGQKIPNGRPDKRFCCPSCKNSYNNSRRRIHSNCKQLIDKAIAHNYNVLDNLVKLKIDQITLSEAATLGLDPARITSYARLGRRTVYSCYDIEFMVSESRIFNIHRIEVYLQAHK